MLLKRRKDRPDNKVQSNDSGETNRIKHDLKLGGKVRQPLGVAVLTVFEHSRYAAEPSDYIGRHRMQGFTLKLLAPEAEDFSLRTLIKQPGQTSVLGQKQIVEHRGMDAEGDIYRRWGDAKPVAADDIMPALLATASPEFVATVDALMAQVTVKSIAKALHNQ